MMYNFDQDTDRRGTCSLKWDVEENELPMWVADMDFQTAPEIIDAVKERAAQGIYGYTVMPEEWYRAYMDWWEVRHHLTVQKEWLIFCSGVVPALSSAVRKLTTPGENVLIQTPVYGIFFNCIRNNGRNVLENRLIYDGQEYHMDFGDLEEKLADPQTTLMILCNPQNPAGKIWDRETLARIGELCEANHVTVISDEIHGDLTAPGLEYIPFSSVSETCARISISCVAPTKTFNLAGLQTAAVIVPNPVLRHKMWRALNTDEAAEANVFAVTAAIAAFTRGKDWLDALRRYLQENKELVVRFLEEELPELRVVSTDATYLLWIHCGRLPGDTTEFARFLRKETGLYLSQGEEFGGDGRQFVRMNIACQRDRVQDGLARLKKGVEAYYRVKSR